MIFYNLLLFFYHLAIRMAAYWNPKAGAWVAGRQEWRADLEKKSARLERPIWIHAASLGEFEQGRPLIEKIKSERPEIPIVLSFYSPSGFEIRKDYQYADLVTYLPADTPANAREFLTILEPRLAIFIKYEFWLNYIFELDKKNIQTFLIAGSFRKNQIFFKWYGGLFRHALTIFDQLFVQTQQDVVLLKKINIENVIVAGDPRIDRVGNIAAQPTSIPIIEKFASSKPVVVLGSSWEPEETILLEYLNQNPDSPYNFIIAPHDISNHHITILKNKLPLPYQTFSDLKTQALNTDTRILIIDNIGMLSSIYQYGKIAFIGGGFGAGIHNILEPAAHELVVLFGKNHRKFPEAKTMIDRGGSFEIANTNDLKFYLDQCSDEIFFSNCAQQNRSFITDNQGATEIIFGYLK